MERRVDLVAEALKGNRYALARLISLIEDGGVEAEQVLAAIHPKTGSAHVVGVTGGPGTGKSTLVNQLALQLRARGKTVGIIAVDPSSPFSGGALLGDRVRMRDLAGDSGVFVRSMATRGNVGGLARATAGVARVLDAAGFDVVLIETIGAGQIEVDIARTAHTTLVIEAPGLGDDVQAIKAGLFEIADIFVVNKVDQPGALRAISALQLIIDGPEMDSTMPPRWSVPILETVALDGTGVAELLDAVDAHCEFLHTTGQWAQRERSIARNELLTGLQQRMLADLLIKIGEEKLQDWIDRVASRERDCYSAVGSILEGVVAQPKEQNGGDA